MSRARKLVWLSLLYFVQGLPFGFQATALPVLLREQGVSLTGIGLAQALSLPWMLKIVWAPLVDRYGSPRFGRRRSFIVPLQILLALATGLAALASPDTHLTALLVLVLLMNLFAATLDIAVDGLAVSLLSPSELGAGNIAQVVGYKAGMLAGGGLLLWASGAIGYEGLFVAMSATCVVVLVATLPFAEPPDRDGEVSPGFREIWRAFVATLKRREMRWVLVFIATYKLGESMADAMFKPFLFDRGFDKDAIGLFLGTYGMIFSLGGSFAGGLLASRTAILRALALTAALRALPVAGELWLVYEPPTAAQVIAVTCAEHFFGGALTTAMFAYMMSVVDRRIGATHYTALASLEVLGKSPSSWLSGLVAERAGYAGVFGVATVLSIAFLALLVPLERIARTEKVRRQ